MSDDMDRAQEWEAELRANALNAHRRKRPTHTDSARECRVCDEPIPEARRVALPGVKTCVECQAELEQALKIKGEFR